MSEKGAAGAEPPALAAPAEAGEQGSLQPFLAKTYQLVDDPATDDVISWNEDGSSFVVWRPAELARDLLPEHFKRDSFESFVRRLDTYGFRKITPDRWEFGHGFFRRGEKPLLSDIHRQDVARPERSMEGPVCALVDAMFRLPAKLDRLLASYGHTLSRGAKDEIPLIKQDLEKMVVILQAQEDSGAEECSMMVKCLTKEVRELSYDMEDNVDQYVHAADSRRGILSPRRKKYKITRRRSKASTRLREKLKWRLWMANKIREFSMRSQEALQRYSLFNHLGGNGISTAAACTRYNALFGSWHPTLYGEPVGIDAPVKKLEEWLGKDGEQKLKVVSVVGSGGIGKTTLAKELYRRTRGQFECRAFVRTSRKPDVRRLLINMLSQIRPHQPPHDWKVHNLIADIRTHLHDKRYFIVIDDIWSTQTWDIINRALPAGNLCSGILITTEIDDVALKCCGYDSKYVLTMKPLGHADSSKLFFSTVFGPQYECPTELNEVANNIIRKCAGLPLAMVIVASLLVNQTGKPEKWDYLNKSLGYGVSTNPSSEGMKQVLNLSYNNLPRHLKACVMYLSMYEEDYIIQKDDLVKQWIAESFIHATEEKDMEEISRIYFDELISSRMIQPVHTNGNGDVLSCTVHHMVLDFIKHKSLEENFVTAIDHCQATAWLADKVRRLSLQFGNAEATTPTNMTLSQVRTLAFFGVIKCLPSILEFRLLQVLILHLWDNDESVSFDLTGISELFRLRYLHVTCNANLEVSQIQMRGLKYLETLNIDARASAVPSDIVHLPGLLHLSVPVETNLPNGIGRMTSLCTLGYFDLSINSIDNVQSLSELTNLRYLRLTCSTVSSSHLKSKMDDVGSILAKLSNLRSVTLEPSSILGDGPSSMSISCDGLSSVSSPPALLQRFEWLPCICTFPSIPKWIGHLNKLCILKIGVRELANNDVDILRGLPALTVLSLYVRVKLSERIFFTKTGFSVLKCFKFRCSVPWLEFEVDAMPNLLKLKLVFDAHGVDQHCTIPTGIIHLIGLKEISAKIGVAGARDPDRRATESALIELIDAIKMHPACPTINIQCLDGMFGGKDDNNSRVQEEEVEHMTLQKQYDIMEEDSIEQHVVLQKDTREDAGSRWEDSAPSSRPCGSIDNQSLGCKSGQSFLKFDSHDLLNNTSPCKMPKIKNLIDACKVSFSPDGPISNEALERVHALLDEIRPLDLGLDKEAKIARNWSSSTRQQKGRRAHDAPNQYASPIKYLHIHECESFSMGIFCMPPSSVIPLHNHPAMTVLSKLLYGKLHTESYDWIDVADPADPLKPRPARCLRDREVTAPETTILYPDRGGNIHTFRAITPCALVDILSPPYSAENGRDVSYFRKSSVRKPSVVLPSDIDSSEVVWLEELEDHQPPEGFVVARGLYKGPAIKGDS